MRLRQVILMFCFLTGPVPGQDTVAGDMGVHQIKRLVELLTVQECKDLLGILSRPEDSIFQQLEHLTAESSPPGVQARHQRAAGYDKPCEAALMDWLIIHGKNIFYDRLFRALQHIGRTDIAKEVGKNINQDKMLNIQKYVEGYHRHVEAIKSSLLQTDGMQQQADKRNAVRRGRDLTRRDLELVVGHERRPPHTRHPLDGALTLISGILLGFAGTFLAAGLVLLFTLHVSRSDLHKLLQLSCKGRARAQRLRRRPRQGRSPETPKQAARETPTQGPMERATVVQSSHPLQVFHDPAKRKVGYAWYQGGSMSDSRSALCC